MREWLAWVRVAQHEWWFVPAGLALLAVVVGAIILGRIAVSRLSGRLLSPRMKGTEDQVESQWATPADLEKFGLVKPKQKGFAKWIRIVR